MKSKPDCTGQRFGMLFVLGKGSKKKRQRCNGSVTYEQMWRLRCDCGATIEKLRSDFENKGQVSCGCKRKRGLVDNKRRPINIAGQRFGTLEAIALSGRKIRNRPAWIMECDCGQVCERTISDIRRCEYYKTRISCGDRTAHPERWLHYPPTPQIYPVEAGRILKNNLVLTKQFGQFVNSEVEDEKRDRLIRVSFIIAFRRSKGEDITDLHERRLISKHLRHCSVDIYRRHHLKYNKKVNQIGDTMTDVTSNDYPVIETRGINIVSRKRIKFLRR